MLNMIGENDLAARLDHSFNRYRGEPVYVRVVNKKTLNLYRPSDAQNGENPFAKINPYDKEFDVSSIKLGYFPHKEKVYYLKRLGLRRFVQGIQERSCSYEPLPGSEIKNTTGNPVKSILFSKDFEDGVLGKYDSLDTVLKRFATQEGYHEAAITRDVAISRNAVGVVNVYFKNKLVGWMAPGTRVVHVPSNEMAWVVSEYIRDLAWTVQ